MTAVMSEIHPLDPARLPPRGLTVNQDTGTVSYNLDGEGAVIRLTPDDALVLAQALLRFVARYRPLYEIKEAGAA